MARGTLRTIAATTFAEYKKYFEKDPALTRRFQVVQVPEPSEAKGILMMRGIATTMEKHHRVQVLDEALEAAVKLSHRYIPARQLPDKAVSLLDTSCARVAISQHGVPAEVEDSRRRIEALDTELEIIAREAQVGVDTKSREADAQEKRAAEVTRLAGLETRWKSEKGLVDRILELRAKLRGAAQPVEGTKSKLEKEAAAAAPPAASPADREALLRELKTLQGELDTLQGDTPLILPSVGEQAVGAVVQDWTGIPVGRMVKNEIETVLKLADTINQRVVGQKHGLDMIARRIQTSRAALDNPNKPIGVFLLCGPSGVGKTETALATRGGALRGRAKRHHDQHERVPGGAHGLHAQGIASRLRRLRRGRRPDRGRAPQAVQRRASRRGRESAPRRPRDLLPGLRQGLDGGRRRGASSISRTRSSS